MVEKRARAREVASDERGASLRPIHEDSSWQLGAGVVPSGAFVFRAAARRAVDGTRRRLPRYVRRVPSVVVVDTRDDRPTGVPQFGENTRGVRFS